MRIASWDFAIVTTLTLLLHCTNSFLIAPKYHNEHNGHLSLSMDESSSSSSSSSSLQDRLRQLREAEQRQELLLNRNWDQGHWSQHVIPLKDPICCLLAGPIVNQEGESLLVVGDVVGQTHFIRPQFMAETNDNARTTPTLIHETATVTTYNLTSFPIAAMAYIPDGYNVDNALICASTKGLYYLNHREDPTAFIDKIEEASSSTSQPLHILQEDMSNLIDLYVTESNDDDELYHVIAVFPNRIQIYQLSLSNDETNNPPAVSLQQEQTTTIFIKEAKPLDDNVESSWNDDSGTIMVTSSAYDAEQGRLYLGLSSGYVHQYGMLLEQSPPCCQCQFRWKINSVDAAITAIAQSSPVMVNRRQEMEILLTGDGHGSVQQWGIMQDNTDRRFLWPQMAQQKLPNRAHHFVGHQDTITQIVPIDALHFVSVAKDGTST